MEMTVTALNIQELPLLKKALITSPFVEIHDGSVFDQETFKISLRHEAERDYVCAIFGYGKSEIVKTYSNIEEDFHVSLTEDYQTIKNDLSSTFKSVFCEFNSEL